MTNEGNLFGFFIDVLFIVFTISTLFVCTNAEGGEVDLFQQIHLSLLNTNDDYFVTFHSGFSTPFVVVTWVTMKVSEEPMVIYSATEQTSRKKLRATTHTYSEGDWKGFIHSVVLTDLQPAMRYDYSVGDASWDLWSPLFHFYSPPSPTQHLHKSRMASVAIFGDAGIFNASIQFYSFLQQNKSIDFVLHIGDFGYSLKRGIKWTVDNSAYGRDKQEAWDIWFRLIQPIAAYKPYMAALGNHEGYPFDYNFIPFSNRFRLPGSNGGLWYWFEYSNFHFVVLSSEHNYSKGSEQYRWLDRHLFTFTRLQNQGRATTTSRTNTQAEDESERNFYSSNDERYEVMWLIVIVHRSMYSSAISQGSILLLRRELEPLLSKYGVDLVLCGHDHSYERTHPVIDAKPVFLEANGNYSKSCGVDIPPIHLRAGTAGIELPEEWYPQPEWSAYRGNTSYGYIRLSSLDTYILRSEFVSIDGFVKDTIHVFKDPRKCLMVDISHHGVNELPAFVPLHVIEVWLLMLVVPLLLLMLLYLSRP
jgi:hypothetical protein